MISDLIGKTLKDIQVIKSSEDRILFITEDDQTYCMYHSQNCCESVGIHDIVGELKDLIGSPILKAEARQQQEPNNYGESMWTFYELATIKGFVTISWFGSSNGYYSIGVRFDKWHEH